MTCVETRVEPSKCESLTNGLDEVCVREGFAVGLFKEWGRTTTWEFVEEGLERCNRACGKARCGRDHDGCASAEGVSFGGGQCELSMRGIVEAGEELNRLPCQIEACVELGALSCGELTAAEEARVSKAACGVYCCVASRCPRSELGE